MTELRTTTWILLLLAGMAPALVFAHGNAGVFGDNHADDHHDEPQHDQASAGSGAAAGPWYPAIVRVDPRKVENVVLKVSARVINLRNLYVGRRVVKGEVLAEFESAELETIQRTYIETFANLDAVSAFSMTAGEKLIEGRMNLQWRGMSEQEVAWIERERRTLERIAVHSPVNGYILSVNVVEGQVTNTGAQAGLFALSGTTLLRIAMHDALSVDVAMPKDDIRKITSSGQGRLVIHQGGAPIPIEATQIERVVNSATQRQTLRVTPNMQAAAAQLRPGAVLQVRLEGLTPHVALDEGAHEH